MNRETPELEAERLRLDAQSKPTRWDRASWICGAMYALGWVINRRGAEVAPLAAARSFIPDDGPAPAPIGVPEQEPAPILQRIVEPEFRPEGA